MQIDSVYGTETILQSGRNNSGEATAADGFADRLQRATEERSVPAGPASTVWEGDMVISQPPNYGFFIYDGSISQKSKEEMTMDEYKQWFMNEMTRIPVSAGFRSKVTGYLIIKEEAFERMKSDPEYETEVLNLLRRHYSAGGMNRKCFVYQVIGAASEENFSYTVSMEDDRSGSRVNYKCKSWWDRRHERFLEIMRENNKWVRRQKQEQKEFLERKRLNDRLLDYEMYKKIYFLQ